MSTEKTNTANAQSLMDPYLRAAKAWGEEMDKLQQMAMDAYTQALEQGYQAAREGMSQLGKMQAQMRGQWQVQLERAGRFYSSFMP